MLELAV